MAEDEKEVVRAAGGVVWRPGANDGDEVELMVVHRPKYDDWTFPKGKVDPGETDEQAALREVDEETGLRCRLGVELPPVHYPMGPPGSGWGRKQVRYWEMTVVSATPREPDSEVDATAWLAAGDVEVRLTYERDRTVLASLLAVLKGV